MDQESLSKDGQDLTSIVEDLIVRANNLLNELGSLSLRLRELRQDGNVELGHFRSTVQSELSMLTRLSQKPNNDLQTHVAKSSNLPFLETLWNTAKKSRNVLALQKRIHVSSSSRALSQRIGVLDLGGFNAESGPKGDAVLVDAIVDNGLTWVKVSLVNNTRLLFDLAKQGWISDEPVSDEEDDHPFNKPDNPDDEDDDVPLLKMAKELARVAQCFRVLSKHPKVHLVLPRLRENEKPEIDKIIAACRRTGAKVSTQSHVANAVPSIDAALTTMAPSPIEDFSDTLNIDCTILLAIVSEFSHATVSKEPWFHAALRRQVEIEGNENLLPALLYPAMASRKLVATREAIVRMREIVDTIGTPSEKSRTRIMLGDDNIPREQLLLQMQELSAHQVPANWQLPIEAISPEENLKAQTQSLPAEAVATCVDMTTINKSVFCYGWAKGYTTITSNRTVVKQVMTTLETNYEDLRDEVWPKIWLCPTARSLVGKEKRGGKRLVSLDDLRGNDEASGAPQEVHEKDEKQGTRQAKAWPLPDPLRREEQRRNGLDVLSQRTGYEVEDLRPNGYEYEDVIKAKNASIR